MDRSPIDRIMGVETEFGCLVDEALGSPEGAVETIKNVLFYDLKLGVLDLHARDEVFEPAESGGFLINGARLYIDAVGSHLEYATAECRKLKDLVANDRAGQRQIVRAIRELGLEDQVSIYNNSVDHFGGHTFGCHENYLVEMTEDFFTRRVGALYPFLITRQIFAGVGRVGGHVLYEGGRPNYREMSENPIDYIWVSNVYYVAPDADVQFQLSQRADHILKTVASRVRFNRALINPKWEHFYSHGGSHRLHLLFGESNQSEVAYALKMGTTSLVLGLVEEELVPEELRLAQPLIALRDVSRDGTYQWPVLMSDGTVVSALDIQRRYLDLCQRYRGHTADADWVLDAWAATLEQLGKDPMALGNRLDWVAKRQVVEEYMREEGLEWDADALHSVDLEYHNIDPDRSLFHALPCDRYLDELDVLDAMTEPPTDTRAFGRGHLVRRALQRKASRGAVFDWSHVALSREEHFDLEDPYRSYGEYAAGK